MAKTIIANRLAVMGLGLMGGSLAAVIKEKKVVNSVVAYARRAETRRLAQSRCIVDKVYARPEDAVQKADLVVFCTPVGTIVPLVKTCMPYFANNCLVTDVASSKVRIVAELEPLFKKSKAEFIGSHPITGSERYGLAAACSTLYENIVVILTPPTCYDKSALNRLKRFWQSLGAEIRVSSAEEHDRLISRTSHLPHLVAALLSSAVGRCPDKKIRDFCGTGFLDTTRIADGSPQLWQDIISSNQNAVLEELKMFQAQLTNLIKILKANQASELNHFLSQSKIRRRKLKR